MFEVLNQDNIICFKTEDFKKAKEIALKMKDELGENFNIYEHKQVWTTQTLDEAIKS